MIMRLVVKELPVCWLANGIFCCVSPSTFAGFYTNWQTGKWYLCHCL